VRDGFTFTFRRGGKKGGKTFHRDHPRGELALLHMGARKGEEWEGGTESSDLLL